MCKVSNKIRFCTCAAPDAYHLKHFWMLHRFVGEKELTILGEPIGSFQLEEELRIYNEHVLLQRLNERDAFDVAMDFEEGDRLLISFSVSVDRGEGRVNYGFAFKHDVWIVADYDVFEWMNQFEEEKFGKVKNPLDRR